MHVSFNLFVFFILRFSGYCHPCFTQKISIPTILIWIGLEKFLNQVSLFLIWFSLQKMNTLKLIIEKKRYISCPLTLEYKLMRIITLIYNKHVLVKKRTAGSFLAPQRSFG